LPLDAPPKKSRGSDFKQSSRRIILRIRSQKDFASGLMFILVGFGFSWVARGYSMGTAAKMGPGYFPFWLGVVLALLGALVLISMGAFVYGINLQMPVWPAFIAG